LRQRAEARDRSIVGPQRRVPGQHQRCGVSALWCGGGLQHRGRTGGGSQGLLGHGYVSGLYRV
jgi:hypothetical protein